MSVGTMLSDLLSQASESKNYIIRETGIDRSTFYQILRGSRVATEEQLEAICRFIDADQETYSKLIDQYEQERAGDKAEQRRNVRRFINALSGEGAPLPESAEAEALQRFVSREKEEGNAEFCMFLPSNSKWAAMLYRVIESLSFEVGEAELRQLIAEETPGRDIVESLRRLNEWFGYLKSQKARFHAYSLRARTEGLYTCAFPYYIVGENSLVLISFDEEQFAVIYDMPVIRAYQDNFDRLTRGAIEVASTESSQGETIESLLGLWRGLSEDAYLLTPKPCLWLSNDKEMVNRYLKDNGLLDYGQAVQRLNWREFTTQSGVDDLMENEMRWEGEFEIRLDAENKERIRRNLEDRRDQSFFLLDESRIHVPKDWQLILVRHHGAMFIPYGCANFRLYITSSEVVEALGEWFESRVNSINNDIVRKEKPFWMERMKGEA